MLWPAAWFGLSQWCFFENRVLLFAYFMLGEKVTLQQLLGIAAMAFLGFGIVLAKQVLDGANVIWATAVRQFGALVVLIPGPSWKYSLPGTSLGSYVALILWIAGMKLIPAGKAAILNQSSTIYILLLATLSIAGVLLVL